MTDFDLLQKELYQQLVRTNTVEILTAHEKQALGKQKDQPLWRVSVEVPIKEGVQDFHLLIQLMDDFPFSLPNIFLQQEEYDTIKFLPHIEDNLKICLFDQENIKIDTERPFDILRASIKRAIKVLSDGITKVNDTDFLDEVVAYWNNIYDPKDKVSPALTGSGIENVSPGIIPAYWLDPVYGQINLLLLPENKDNEKLLNFFKRKGHHLKQQNAFYLGELTDLQPPFYFTNVTAYEFVHTKFPLVFSDFKRYFNQGNERKAVVFSVNIDGTPVFFAFFYFPLTLKQNGWRQQSITPVLWVTRIRPNEPVSRLSFKAFEQKRLTMRTDGVMKDTPPKEVTVMGLGSIGSHLVEYLCEMNISGFNLVDPENLVLENVNRHLLSYYEVGHPKVQGIAKYLQEHNPFVDITVHKTSVIDLVKKNAPALSADILFCVIGKDAIENFLLQYVANGKIAKPLVIMWVEPFLAGGHLLYVVPGTNLRMKDLEKDGYYRHNVLASETYRDQSQQILLKEAGCQGSYIPYGKSAIRHYFSAILPELHRLVDTPLNQCTILTYVGDLEQVHSYGLKTAPFATESFKLSIQSL